MSTLLDGTYSIVASAKKGSALGIAKIRSGSFVGRDTGGAIYSGSAARIGDTVILDLNVQWLPGAFSIWGTDPTETHCSLTLAMPADYFHDGKPYFMEDYQVLVISRRVSDEEGVMAGPGGFRAAAEKFAEYERRWAAYDAA